MSSGFGRAPVPGAASLRTSEFSPRSAVLQLVGNGGSLLNQWRLDQLRMLLGRADPSLCQPQIDLGPYDSTQPSSISRRHAELYWEDGKLMLIDLGSLNGTWHNNERLATAGLRTPSMPVVLSCGDRLRFGLLECRIDVAGG